MLPNLNEEKKLWKKGFKGVACLDEVGRGCLAGPVIAAAVVIQNTKYKIQDTKIKDSKKLSPKKREEFYKILTKHPDIKWGTGRVYQSMIDKINILEATKLAMERAMDNLKSKIQNPKSKIDFLILDGNMRINSAIPQKSIVKADEKVFSCAAASIIAKVKRDRLMLRYAKRYPQYFFERHKAYGTLQHCKLLKKHGPCKIHRRSFGMLKSCQTRQILIE